MQTVEISATDVGYRAADSPSSLSRRHGIAGDVAKLHWGMLGLASCAVLLPGLVGPLRRLGQEVGVASSWPVLESLGLLLLIPFCFYQVFSHAHAGFLAQYPRWIRSVRGFAVAMVNDMSTYLLMYMWSEVLGAKNGPVRLIFLGGAALHAIYLLMLLLVPRWFLYEASNLRAATLREDAGPRARARWKRLIYAPGRYIMVWIDCAAHMVGLLALLTVAFHREAWTLLSLGLLMGTGAVLIVYGAAAGRSADSPRGAQ